MTDGTRPKIDQRLSACCKALDPRGQTHVLRFWGELDPAQKDALLGDIECVPWGTLDPLIDTHVRATPEPVAVTDLRPAPVYPFRPGESKRSLYDRARALGERLIAKGKVAALTVAGGQGSRLGFDGPKGVVKVTPVGDRSLFELFARTVKAVRDRHGARLRWYIMTSPANHDQTVDYFAKHNYFGLPPDDVRMFSQAMLPAFDMDGKLLLSSKHSLALAPDGHGGSLKALVASGSLADMQAHGVEIITYFQVDNPLVKPFDPLFVGLHATTGSEMSSKVAAKADDFEKVGNVCICGSKLRVIEYTDFAESYARARTPDGRRKFDAGNLAIHMFNVSFVDRIVGASFALPYRRAEKIVPCIDEEGNLRRPDRPNAIKLETFVFDALPLAANPLVLEVDRAEEFSPVKNMTGVDSLETAIRDQNRRACRWLEAAGVSVPRKPSGEPDMLVAIDPSFAVDAVTLIDRSSEIPKLSPGDRVLLS